MIRKSIIDRVNRYAKNRGLKVTEIKEIEFITNNGNSWLFCEMDCNKRHWFIV
jgi:hypothetical protein